MGAYFSCSLSFWRLFDVYFCINFLCIQLACVVCVSPFDFSDSWTLNDI